MTLILLTEAQIQAVKCAYADLCGALEARNQRRNEVHDWKAHRETIRELEKAFDFIEPITKKYTVTFEVKLVTTIEVKDGSELSDALSNIDIPETTKVQYQEDSFQVLSVKDENGNIVEDEDENHEEDYE